MKNIKNISLPLPHSTKTVAIYYWKHYNDSSITHGTKRLTGYFTFDVIQFISVYIIIYLEDLRYFLCKLYFMTFYNSCKQSVTF